VRFYRIEIGTGAAQKVYTSHPGGVFDPACLDVELDIFAFNYATAAGGGMDVRSFVRIYGVPLSVVAQATNLNGQPVAVYGGMGKGFPLATAAANQAGLLAKGTIYPALGNWIGTDTTLDLVLAPPLGSNYAPVNISTNWKKGTQLSAALKTALGAAFPNFTLDIKISPNLVLNYDQPFVYGTLQQLAQFARSMSQKILGDKTYLGVQLVTAGNKIMAYDGTTAPSTTKQIAYQDLIGQPTWLGFTVNLKTVLRADISVGDLVQLPPAIAIVTPQAALLPRNSVSFAGKYMVQQIRHVGRARQADAASWCTIIDAASVPGSNATQVLGGPQGVFN
jgi:gamma-glutamylcyclotransferase (GGCT)/AIG2-like uncharacterized protein YtfP